MINKFKDYINKKTGIENSKAGKYPAFLLNRLSVNRFD